MKLANNKNEQEKLAIERDKILSEKDEREAKLGGSAAERQQTVLDATNRATELVNAIENHPGLSEGTGLGGDYRAWFNGSKARDFRVKVDRLRAVQFLTGVPGMKGLGALSDAEGKKLDSAISNLDTAQSESAFRNELNISKKYLLQQQRSLIASKKLATNNGAFVGTDGKGGDITEGMINAMLEAHPGSTREQALSYLKTVGK